jgi:hypothetical protein
MTFETVLEQTSQIPNREQVVPGKSGYRYVPGRGERTGKFLGSRNWITRPGMPRKCDLRKLDYDRPMERRSIAVRKVQKRREAGLCGACVKSPCECRRGARRHKRGDRQDDHL